MGSRLEIDKAFLSKMLITAGPSLYLQFRAYLFFLIARALGSFPNSHDSYQGCGISRWWATGEQDPFFEACKFHDSSYEDLKG